MTRKQSNLMTKNILTHVFYFSLFSDMTLRPTRQSDYKAVVYSMLMSGCVVRCPVAAAVINVLVIRDGIDVCYITLSGSCIVRTDDAVSR